MTPAPPIWKLKLLYDGLCPVCAAEVRLLRRRNRGAIAFEDIADPQFDPTQYGLTMQQVVGSMHAVLPDGSTVAGVDVFARAYELVGWAWLARLLRAPVVRHFAKVGYAIFARVRPRLSRFDPAACANGRCAVTSPHTPPTTRG